MLAGLLRPDVEAWNGGVGRSSEAIGSYWPPHVQRLSMELLMNLSPQSSQMSHISAMMCTITYPSKVLQSHFLELWVFCQSGTLTFAWHRSSIARSLFCSSVWLVMRNYHCDFSHCTLAFSNSLPNTQRIPLSPVRTPSLGAAREKIGRATAEQRTVTKGLCHDS